MTIDSPTSDGPTVQQAPRRRGTVALAAALSLVDLVVVFVGLVMIGRAAENNTLAGDRFNSQDMWVPFALLLLVLAAVNGVVLLIGSRTRAAGIGVFVGLGLGFVLLGIGVVGILSGTS